MFILTLIIVEEKNKELIPRFSSIARRLSYADLYTLEDTRFLDLANEHKLCVEKLQMWGRDWP